MAGTRHSPTILFATHATRRETPVPVFEASCNVACTTDALFDFLTRPANLALVAPPEMDLSLGTAPERLALDAVLTVYTRRWGLTQRFITQVTAFEPGRSFVEEQRMGPFKKMARSHVV